MKKLDLRKKKTFTRRKDSEIKDEAPNLGFIIFLFVVFISAYLYFSNYYFQ
ncbi:MAG: hypothetical protein JXR51_12785 [Bacteroidales bacterium]|nr:hypothetical protein [Bacteroidales bacterium]